ncbi:hypothetical protein B0T25DRAFT_4058 [Lasiosphaeria hispida]|uniref:Uncharacterized protein n=1 Tax=Lasiosphaeria hispida TaxID=260671 RepID=A0AAJ0HT91_9PEZI|nr:hypothetical protein B0T25DRAFT_4058 [Lasiosphaeria hispida]
MLRLWLAVCAANCPRSLRRSSASSAWSDSFSSTEKGRETQDTVPGSELRASRACSLIDLAIGLPHCSQDSQDSQDNQERAQQAKIPKVCVTVCETGASLLRACPAPPRFASSSDYPVPRTPYPVRIPHTSVHPEQLSGVVSRHSPKVPGEMGSSASILTTPGWFQTQDTSERICFQPPNLRWNTASHHPS